MSCWDTERQEIARGTHFLKRSDQDLSGQETLKENKLAIGTYSLERAKVRTGQDMEREQASNRYLLPGEGKGQDWSGHGKKTS